MNERANFLSDDIVDHEFGLLLFTSGKAVINGRLGVEGIGMVGEEFGFGDWTDFKGCRKRDIPTLARVADQDERQGDNRAFMAWVDIDCAPSLSNPPQNQLSVNC